MNPKVSVIVPVYCVEQYLDRCVSSLLNQTLKDIEIILIDDESPDNCPQLCDEYANEDYRIKVVHKKNGGLGFARNSGLEVSTGEYVAFLDSDDFVDIDTYEWLYKNATKYNLDAIFYKYAMFSDAKDINERKNIEGLNILSGEKVTLHLSMEMIGSLPSEKKDRNVEMSSCTAFYKKSIINSNQICFHSERELISEDLIFNLDFLQKAQRVAFSQQCFYHYFVNTSSLTHQVRLDRVEKNIILYNYLSLRLAKMNNISDMDRLRPMRMLIGYCRSSILQVLKSNLSKREKVAWIRKVCSNPIWKEIYSVYPVKKMPPKYALFLFAKRFHFYKLLIMMSKI